MQKSISLSTYTRQGLLSRTKFKGVGIMSEKIKIKEKREEFESLVQSWNGTEMWFQERMQQFPGIVEINTDDWGVKIIIISEYYRKFSVSGRWDILSVWSSGMSALYCGWTLDKEMIWPELGIIPSEKITNSEKEMRDEE